jgi:pyruvate ferredoxin oxidoreductase alpha subunit
MFLALRLAEHKDVLLPAMVMQDGFIISHGVENVKILDDEVVKKFVGERNPDRFLLDVKNPYTIGPLALPDYYFEIKRQQEEAMINAKRVYLEVGGELSKITGNKYSYFEEYKMEDSQAVIVVLSSAAGTAKDAIDEMRAEGKKVGLLKPKLFRPFPYKEMRDALKDIPVVGVLDRSMSFGSYAPLYTEIRNSLFELETKPKLQSYIFGLGGKDIFKNDIKQVFEELLSGAVDSYEQKYIGLRG